MGNQAGLHLQFVTILRTTSLAPNGYISWVPPDGGWNMNSLEKKIAAVTGAGSGIGRAIALALAGSGARVLVSDLDPDSAGRVAREVEGRGGESRAVKLDVTRKADSQAAVERVVEEW